MRHRLARKRVFRDAGTRPTSRNSQILHRRTKEVRFFQRHFRLRGAIPLFAFGPLRCLIALLLGAGHFLLSFLERGARSHRTLSFYILSRSSDVPATLTDFTMPRNCRRSSTPLPTPKWRAAKQQRGRGFIPTPTSILTRPAYQRLFCPPRPLPPPYPPPPPPPRLSFGRASLTFIARPPSSFPFRPAMARPASA